MSLYNNNLTNPESTPEPDEELQSDGISDEKVSAGEKARADDVTDVIATIRAMQDAQRKQDAEASEATDLEKQ